MIVARRMLLTSGILSSFGVLAAHYARAQGSSVWIVSSSEANLPPSPTSKAGRAITRGPAIRQIAPVGVVPANTPFELRVEFAGRGGEKIAPASVHVTLLRGNDIDITQRLKAYISPSGIAVPNAMVPPGTYVLQVAVSDTGDRQSIANIGIDAR